MGENYDDYLRDDNLHINWYPGHMKKTRDLVRNNLKLVDVVVELLDSRIPFSSRNPDIDNLAGNKPRVVILNKCDLADRAKLDKWIKYYKDRGIKAIPVDTLKGVGLNKLVDECRNAVKDKMDALKEKEGYYVFHAGTAKKDGQIVTNGGRVLGVVAKGDDLKQARANAYKAIDLVEFDNKYYRHDIGKAIDEA